MRIGISVITHEGQNIWSNGLGQNVFHLVRTFRSLPFVTDVILLNSGDQTALSEHAAPGCQDIKLVKPRDATDMIDVVFELGGGLDVEWLDYIRALGKKVVFYMCGHPFTGLVEGAVFSKPAYFTRPDRCDEVWILPMYSPFRAMLQAMHRCSVLDANYIWSPDFIEGRAKQVAEHGLTFGYKPNVGGARRPLRGAIFEPNISVTKVGVIPMMVCDVAYRRNRDAIAGLHVLNTMQFVNHATFNFLANGLDIVKAGKALFLGRHDFVAHMAEHADLVISHQWRHDQNYLYLDALYGDYPLIHNSPWLGSSVGYYYPDFDIEAGAEQVLAAWAHHDENLSSYRKAAQGLIASVDPLSPANRDHYARRLLNLEAAPSSRKSA